MPLADAIATPEGKRTYVRRLFATIADRYDLITVVLSYGQDRRWKQRLVAMAAPRAGARAADLATGTGDIAFALQRAGAVVVGVDVTWRMIELANQKARATEHAEREGVTFVSATADPDVIAGQGTAALEILEDMKAVRTIVLPVGGAGLLAGFGSLLRAEAPTVRIVGVQGTRSDAMARALEAGKLVHVSHEDTLADGLSGDIDDLALDVGKHSLDALSIVTEEEIAMAIAWLSREEGLVVEGSGAVGVGALVQRKVYRPQGPVAVVLTGGNIDAARHAEIVARYAAQGIRGGTPPTSVSPL